MLKGGQPAVYYLYQYGAVCHRDKNRLECFSANFNAPMHKHWNVLLDQVNALKTFEMGKWSVRIKKFYIL